ncbi:MAG: hypothetical protein KGN84_17090, partial [Acidobacteriota bacterium]|nr:hypothetical protein [Acidobacteriota bacterium]
TLSWVGCQQEPGGLIADFRTTEIYPRVDPPEKWEAVEAAVPLSPRRGRFKAPDEPITSLFEARRCGAPHHYMQATTPLPGSGFA